MLAVKIVGIKHFSLYHVSNSTTREHFFNLKYFRKNTCKYQSYRAKGMKEENVFGAILY